jgi:hypothetical protein
MMTRTTTGRMTTGRMTTMACEHCAAAVPDLTEAELRAALPGVVEWKFAFGSFRGTLADGGGVEVFRFTSGVRSYVSVQPMSDHTICDDATDVRAKALEAARVLVAAAGTTNDSNTNGGTP